MAEAVSAKISGMWLREQPFWVLRTKVSRAELLAAIQSVPGEQLEIEVVKSKFAGETKTSPSHYLRVKEPYTAQSKAAAVADEDLFK